MEVSNKSQVHNIIRFLQKSGESMTTDEITQMTNIMLRVIDRTR